MTDQPSERRLITPLKSQPKLRDLAVFDVEGTGDENGFILGSVVWANGHRIFHDRSKMAKFLLTKRFRSVSIFAANLQYDLPILYQPFAPGWELIMKGSKLLKATYRDKNKNLWHFYDSFNVAPHFSVSRMGEFLGYPKWETPPELLGAGAQAAEWTCNVHSSRWCVECYCLRDSEITFAFLSHFQDTIFSLGTQLKWTLPSSAMELWRRKYIKRTYREVWPDINDHARQAYYGGRVEIYKKGTVRDLLGYDINSLYPYVMANTVLPDPDHIRFWRGKDIPIGVLAYPGISRVEIESPDLYIPLLPVRIKGKLYFPVGRWEGAYCHNELLAAIKLGYTIHCIKWSIWSERGCRPFESYVTDLYEVRREMLSKNDPREWFIKLYLNSLYGRFGLTMNNDLGKVVHHEMLPLHKIPYGSIPVEWGDDLYFVVPWLNDRQPVYRNILWAATVTAAARLELYRSLSVIGKEAAYCDTDSLYSSVKLRTGDGLGDWKLEADVAEATFMFPKLYQLLLRSGDQRYKVRGIPARYMREFFERGSVTFSQPTKIRGAMRRDKRIAVWENVMKEMGVIEDKRRVCGTVTDGTPFLPTTPYEVDELISMNGGYDA